MKVAEADTAVVENKQPVVQVIRVAADLRSIFNAIVSYELTNQLDLAERLLRPVIEARFAELPEDFRKRVLARAED